MINILVLEEPTKAIHIRDSMDQTPLHAAASCSDDDEEEINERIACIDRLVELNADINATDIRQETPLHLACKTGSHLLVKHLVQLKADLLVTNIQGYNCLEVAIEEKNEKVVKYLLEHEHMFELMRNAQSQYTDYTPMRKLIRSMPDMALLVLEKCTLTVGVEKSHIHLKVYNYEFFEDHYLIDDWKKGKNCFCFQSIHHV